MNNVMKNILIFLLILILGVSAFSNDIDELSKKDDVSKIDLKEKSNKKNGIWISAKDLKPGMKVLGVDGKIREIKEVEIVKRNEKTYNFEVKDNHTYTVGKQSLIVHNECDFGIGGQGSKESGGSEGAGGQPGIPGGQNVDTYIYDPCEYECSEACAAEGNEIKSYLNEYAEAATPPIGPTRGSFVKIIKDNVYSFEYSKWVRDYGVEIAEDLWKLRISPKPSAKKNLDLLLKVLKKQTPPKK